VRVSVRVRIDLSYDGTDFKGWAAQPLLRTVQGELTAALHAVLRLPEGTLWVTCAGRTDSGVHARGQVVHVDLPDGTAPEVVEGLRIRLNGYLAKDVRVRRVAVAPPGFDARFAALWRRYAYRIVDSTEAVDPLTRGHVVHWRRPLDVAAMDEAAARLLGLHDFAAFCKKREGATTIRTLQEFSWSRDERGVITGHVKADAFCHSMVRALVGCMVLVGEGKQDADWAASILSGRVRDQRVHVMAARGLVLEEVGYPDDAGLAARVEATAARRQAREVDGRRDGVDEDQEHEG
jgi:tRNA pseudouridine38-40 synthase